MADDTKAGENEAANAAVDDDPGLPIPESEEQAERLPDPPGEQAKAEEVARDETVVGNTEIPGTGGGTRFFGAEPQS
jgi:hypothetical protein